MVGKKLVPVLLVMCLLVTLLGGCGGTGAGTSAQADAAAEGSAAPAGAAGELAPYTVKWYMMGTPQPDVKTVEEAINKITEGKINTKVELYFIDPGSYDEKMRISLASGDDIDMCFTSNFTNDYIQNVSKGAFREITMEELNRLAPNMMAAIPQEILDASMVGGKYYGMPIERVCANTPGIMVQRQYVDKYDFDLDAVETMADFTPLFEAIAAGEPGVTSTDITAGSGIYAFSLTLAGMEILSGGNPAGIVIGESDPEIVNLFETQEMKDFLYLLRQWYQDGIIRQDAATVFDLTAEYGAGKLASRIVTSNPDTLANQAVVFNMSPDELVIKELSKPYMSTNTVLGGQVGIARTSQDPERCIMLYDLLFDKEDTRLMNLINFGVEGTHYNLVDGDVAQRIDGSGYYFGMAWQFGSLFNCYRESPDQPNWREAGEAKMAQAQPSAILGFSLDPEPIKVELAQCQSVFDEYIPALFTGSVDVDEYLAAFVEKLEAAGSQKIVDEANAQLEAWKAAKA